MSKYITVVLEYKDGQKQPRFGAGMKVLGGNVDSVQFDNALKVIEDLEQDLSRTKAELEEAKELIDCLLFFDEGGFSYNKTADKAREFLSNQQSEE